MFHLSPWPAPSAAGLMAPYCVDCGSRLETDADRWIVHPVVHGPHGLPHGCPDSDVPIRWASAGASS